MGEQVEYSRQYTFKTIVLCIREVDQAHSLVLSLFICNDTFFYRLRLFVMTRRLRTRIRHWCCRFYCFTVVQWPGRPERLQFLASLPDVCRSRPPLLPRPLSLRLSFPLPDGVPMGRGIAAAKGCWGYPGGRGKNLLWERVGGLYLTPLLWWWRYDIYAVSINVSVGACTRDMRMCIWELCLCIISIYIIYISHNLTRIYSGASIWFPRVIRVRETCSQPILRNNAKVYLHVRLWDSEWEKEREKEIVVWVLAWR